MGTPIHVKEREPLLNYSMLETWSSLEGEIYPEYMVDFPGFINWPEIWAYDLMRLIGALNEDTLPLKKVMI